MLFRSPEVLKQYQLFLKLRSDVLKALEEARSVEIIGSAQEASVEVEILDEKTLSLFDKMNQMEIRRLFGVSSLNFVKDLKDVKKREVSKVKVIHHLGKKCDRCWNYSDDTTEIEGFNICPRCQKVLGK